MNNNLKTHLLWKVFKPSFSNNLPLLGIENQKNFMKNAKKEYKKIINKIPAYGNNDVLYNTIINASVLASIYITVEIKPSIEIMREYYKKSMSDNKIAVV
ncbi:MAG: hypothetical protein PHW21_05160 [Candidatus Izemoplasmatales bacterium]|jgi:hypothetical protein|nr:hypothetical protein [Candidatus Izemoplasmatales bacterium]